MNSKAVSLSVGIVIRVVTVGALAWCVLLLVAVHRTSALDLYGYPYVPWVRCATPIESWLQIATAPVTQDPTFCGKAIGTQELWAVGLFAGSVIAGAPAFWKFPRHLQTRPERPGEVHDDAIDLWDLEFSRQLVP